MKNKLLDLDNHLFAQLERLSEEETTGEMKHRQPEQCIDDEVFVETEEYQIENAYFTEKKDVIITFDMGATDGFIKMNEKQFEALVDDFRKFIGI